MISASANAAGVCGRDDGELQLQFRGCSQRLLHARICVEFTDATARSLVDCCLKLLTKMRMEQMIGLGNYALRELWGGVYKTGRSQDVISSFPCRR